MSDDKFDWDAPFKPEDFGAKSFTPDRPIQIQHLEQILEPHTAAAMANARLREIIEDRCEKVWSIADKDGDCNEWSDCVSDEMGLTHEAWLWNPVEIGK